MGLSSLVKIVLFVKKSSDIQINFHFNRFADYMNFFSIGLVDKQS